MTSKLSVLHVISSLDPNAGGVSQALRTIIKSLAAFGISSEVASIDAPDAAYLGQDSFAVHAMGPGKTAWQYAPKLTAWLKANMERYDVVIVHGLWQYQTYAARKAFASLKNKKTRLFVMPHGMLDPYFQKAKGRRLKAIRNEVVWFLNEKNIINIADHLLFTCETERLLAKEPFSPYHPKAENVVGLGVEPPPLYNAGMKAAFERKIGKALPAYLLFISRINEKKGVDLLVNAYIQLKKEKIKLPPLVVAGPGLDTPYGKALADIAASDKDIYFPGMLLGDEKWGAFYGCEVFILPSHQENFGIAVVEALACGKPVLISDQVNIWREIVDEHAGWATADTYAGVYENLKNWVSAPDDVRARLTSKTGTAFNKYFSTDAFCDKMIALLNK